MSNADQGQATPDALVAAVEALAARFRASSDEVRASAVEGSLAGEPDQLPRRVLALFSRGTGGISDEPLYRLDPPHSKVDREATDDRDQLAHLLFKEARRRL